MSRQDVKKHSSRFDEKIYLRRKAIQKIKKDKIKVLDCFHAQGQIWSKLQSIESDIDFTIIGIEKEKSKRTKHFVVHGDNRKILPSLDIFSYDIIDLDAYGSCFQHINLVLNNPTYNPNTIVVYTQISTGMGGISHDIFAAIGVDKIAKKSPTILSPKTQQREYFHAALETLGINKVTEFNFTEKGSNKLYGFFQKQLTTNE